MFQVKSETGLLKPCFYEQCEHNFRKKHKSKRSNFIVKTVLTEGQKVKLARGLKFSFSCSSTYFSIFLVKTVSVRVKVEVLLRFRLRGRGRCQLPRNIH